MQRIGILWVVLMVGCSDDGRNKTAPDTALVEVPAAVTNETHVRILFEARGNANGFECTFDGQVSECISPFEADVTDGEHTFAVAAKLNQNLDETPATHAWRIDTVTPETTITSAPPSLDNSVSPQFEFTGTDGGGGVRAAAPVTFECSLDGDPFQPCTSPFTLTVVDGLHAFAVRAKDEAGNVDPTPAMHGWTIDATAPETTITAGPAAGATTGPSGMFEFEASEPTATFECQLDAGAFAPCTSPHAFTLGDGSHTFAVRAKDDVGTVDPSPATRTWTVDAVAPPVTITATPTNPSNDTTPQFSFSSTDPTATFECQIDGVVTFTACTSPWPGPTVTDGNRTFRVRATDPVGNVGAPATFAWVVDTAPPTVTLTAVPAALSNDSTPTVSFTTAGGATATACRVDMGAFGSCSSPFTSAALGDGAHTITVRATDAAGNEGFATTPSFTIDTVAPTVTFTSLPAALSNDTTPTVQFTTAGNPTSTQCRVDTGGFTTCTSGFTPTVVQGAHTIGVRVADAAGNSAIFTTPSFTVDTTPPNVTITGQPAALSNDNDPTVVFTTDGMSPTCQLDTGAQVTCTSPHTFANVADGNHTITVRAQDAAGNVGSATTSQFRIDTVGPTLAFTEQAPASWPVNYFDYRFTVGDSATVECAVDGGAFAPCSSPRAVTSLSYGVAHTLSVRGTDAAGNQTTITSNAVTPARGLVLHYPWEQGDTDNTSLLKQVPSHSPDGTVASVAAFVGGWAGSALGGAVPAHQYARTIRPLTSSPDGTYTVSFWIRTVDGASGTILSTQNGTTGGLRISLAGGNQLTAATFENGVSANPFTTTLEVNRWVHIGLLTTGFGKGLQVFVDGQVRGNVQSISGFNAGQATNLTVGNWTTFDIDDLRVFNLALSGTEICTKLARGFMNQAGACVPLAPGFEVDFEGDRIADTGFWNMLLIPPPVGGPPPVFTAHTLGDLLASSGITADWGYSPNGPSFASLVTTVPGHTLTFEFVPGSVFGRIIDWRAPCSFAGGPPVCGMAVTYADNNLLQIHTGTPGEQKTTSLGTADGLVANRFNNIVLAEQRTANGTVSLTVFVNGKKTVIPIAGGDLYAFVSSDVKLVGPAGLAVDEYELWPVDLAANTELLCENGLDGEFDVVTSTCALTYGP